MTPNNKTQKDHMHDIIHLVQTYQECRLEKLANKEV